MVFRLIHLHAVKLGMKYIMSEEQLGYEEWRLNNQQTTFVSSQFARESAVPKTHRRQHFLSSLHHSVPRQVSTRHEVHTNRMTMTLALWQIFD